MNQRNRAKLSWTAGLLLLWLGGVLSGRAALPRARLWTVYPAGAQIGTNVEVSISGVDLEQVKLVFSEPQISARVITNKDASEPVRFVVTVPATVAPGRYEARAAGRYGISNSRAFEIGREPQRLEKDAHAQMESAMEMAVGEIIDGRMEKDSVDYYRVRLRKGERVRFECKAGEIDSKALPVMAVLDEHGNELERSHPGQRIQFAAKADEVVYLDVHDFLYQGGAEYFYRVSAVRSPRIDFVFPAAGAAGSSNEFRLYGWNLPGGHPGSRYGRGTDLLDELAVAISLPRTAERVPRLPLNAAPSALGMESVAFRWQGPGATEGAAESNPVLVGLADNPVVVEREPNNAPEAAQPVNVPCEVEGEFYPAGDRDWFQFGAKKGEVYWIEIFCERLGIASDPFLVIQRLKKSGKGEEAVDVKELYDTEANVGGAEFRMSHRDSAWRLAVTEDATYRIEARDLFNETVCDPGHVYRLCIRREHPDFHLAVMSIPPPKPDKKEAHVSTSFLRRGDRALMTVFALRKDNFDGAIDLRVEGLPPGIRSEGGIIEAGSSKGAIVLEADAAAAGWAGAIRVIGKAMAAGQTIEREAEGAEVLWNVDDYNRAAVPTRRSAEIVTAVSGEEAAPMRMEAGKAEISAAPGATVEIPVELHRSGDFNGKVKLWFASPEGLAGFAPIESAERATNAVLQLDLKKYKLGPGSHRLVVQGETSGKYQRPARIKGEKPKAEDATVVVYSRPIHLEVREVPLAKASTH